MVTPTRKRCGRYAFPAKELIALSQLFEPQTLAVSSPEHTNVRYALASTINADLNFFFYERLYA